MAINVVFLNDLKEAEDAAVGRFLDGDQTVALTDFGGSGCSRVKLECE